MLTKSTTSISTAFVSCAFSALCLLLITLFPAVHAATPDEWRTRSIYQIITDRFARTDNSTTSPCSTADRKYCGGTFQGIINQLDYIQGMGFTAIWISPVVSNIPETTAYGQGYHGFWPQNIYTINEHFGTADELKQLAAAVHKRGMLIMIDVVVNDLASAGWGNKTDFSKMIPFNKKEYYHPFCFITDYTDQLDAQDCWLGDDVVALADLNTENDFVKNTWYQWVGDLVANYSLDGLRIDAAKHVNHDFWAKFNAAAGVFTLGEVFDRDPNATCAWAVDALDSVLNYPAWYNVVEILANSSNAMGSLGYVVNDIAANCHDSTLLGTFSENHDVARFGSASTDLSHQKNAVTFDLMTDGIPVIYYGAEQRFTGENDPGNREALWLAPNGYDTNAPLYKLIRSLNLARTAVGLELKGKDTTVDYSNWSGYWAYKTKILYSTDDILVFRKGYDTSIITALTNKGEGGQNVGPYHMGDTDLVTNSVIVDIVACKSLRVGYDGEFDITLVNGEPQVWVPARYLRTTSGICEDLMKKLNSSGQTVSTSDGNKAGAPANWSGLLGSLMLCVISAAVVFSGS